MHDGGGWRGGAEQNASNYFTKGVSGAGGMFGVFGGG